MAGHVTHHFEANTTVSAHDERFRDALRPILQEIGVDDEPEMCQAHTFVSA
jgi:hypothetical protein